MLKNRSIVMMSCVIGVGAMSFALLESAMPIEFDARGWSRSVIGLVFAFAALAHTLMSPVSGAMADRLSRKKMMVVGLLLLALLLPVPAFVKGLAPTFAIMACLGLIATISGSPVAPAVTSAVDDMGGGGYSSAFGLINLTIAVGLMIGPLLGGVGVDLVGIRPSLLAFAAVLGLYALVIARFLPREGKAAGSG
jgi:MFS family permease